MKQFIFLYPLQEIINFEIEHHRSKREAEAFRKRYKFILNRCIDARYRQKGFGINYAVFNGDQVSNIIALQQSDRVIEVGLDFKTHTTKKPNGEYTYPNPDYILNQLNNIEVIRIAGFHMWDCVEKLAKRSYERGLDTLVDEDLTESFSIRFSDPDFKIDEYPTYDARKNQGGMFDMFMAVRKERPWLWQDY